MGGACVSIGRLPEHSSSFLCLLPGFWQSCRRGCNALDPLNLRAPTAKALRARTLFCYPVWTVESTARELFTNEHAYDPPPPPPPPRGPPAPPPNEKMPTPWKQPWPGLRQQRQQRHRRCLHPYRCL